MLIPNVSSILIQRQNLCASTGKNERKILHRVIYELALRWWAKKVTQILFLCASVVFFRVRSIQSFAQVCSVLFSYRLMQFSVGLSKMRSEFSHLRISKDFLPKYSTKQKFEKSYLYFHSYIYLHRDTLLGKRRREFFVYIVWYTPCFQPSGGYLGNGKIQKRRIIHRETDTSWVFSS